MKSVLFSFFLFASVKTFNQSGEVYDYSPSHLNEIFNASMDDLKYYRSGGKYQPKQRQSGKPSQSTIHIVCEAESPISRNYSNGWEIGYSEGWCYERGPCVAPVPPVAPAPRAYEDS